MPDRTICGDGRQVCLPPEGFMEAFEQAGVRLAGRGRRRWGPMILEPPLADL